MSSSKDSPRYKTYEKEARSKNMKIARKAKSEIFKEYREKKAALKAKKKINFDLVESEDEENVPEVPVDTSEKSEDSDSGSDSELSETEVNQTELSQTEVIPDSDSDSEHSSDSYSSDSTPPPSPKKKQRKRGGQVLYTEKEAIKLAQKLASMSVKKPKAKPRAKPKPKPKPRVVQPQTLENSICLF